MTIFALALMFSGIDSTPVEDRLPGSMDLYMTFARKYISWQMACVKPVLVT